MAQGLGAVNGVRQNVGGRIGYYYTSAYVSNNYYFFYPHYFGMRDEGSAHWMWHSFSFYKVDTGPQRCSLQIWSVNSDGFPGTAVTGAYTSSGTTSTGTIAVSTLSADVMKPGWYFVRAKFTDSGSGSSRVASVYRSNGAAGQSMGTMWNTLEPSVTGTSSVNANQVYAAFASSGNINLPTTRVSTYPLINIRTGVDSNIEEAGAGTFNTGATY